MLLLLNCGHCTSRAVGCAQERWKTETAQFCPALLSRVPLPPGVIIGIIMAGNANFTAQG